MSHRKLRYLSRICTDDQSQILKFAGLALIIDRIQSLRDEVFRGMGALLVYNDLSRDK